MTALRRYVPWALVLLSGAGFAIGSYLTIAHWGDQPIACGGVGDCGLVNSSEYASVAGIPVSALGTALYLGMTAVALAWARNTGSERLPIVFWGMALSGALYAGYLTYVELAVLHAICVWCVTSACILASALALSSWAVFGAPETAPEEGPRAAKASPRARRVAHSPTSLRSE